MQKQTLTARALKDALGQGNGVLDRLLQALPAEVSDRLLSQAALCEVPAGHTIIDRGGRSDVVGYVLEGTLGMIQTFDDGRKHIVGLLGPTDSYGRLFDGEANYRIEALSPARMVTFPRAVLEDVLRSNLDAERLFLVHLLDEVDAAREWLLSIGGRRTINRVASFLAILTRRARFQRGDLPEVVHVPISRSDLARYLGARPETLSRAFHELENRRILRILDSSHFEILDQTALIEAAGDDLPMEGPRLAGMGG